MKYTTYVGSYTGESRMDGIHILECDAATGDFRTMRVIDTLANPTYMALNKAGTRLYTVCDCPDLGKGWRNGGLAAFAVDGLGDRLTLRDRISTGWGTACHVSLDPSERAVVYADYGSGTAGYVNLKGDGSFDPACAGVSGQVVAQYQARHAGDGPNKPRQDSAHPHCAIVTPDGKYLMVVDLTLDKVVAYDFAHRAEVGMKEVPSATIDTRKIAPGAGPRHLVFHPNGKLAFLIFELLNKVASFRYTGEGFEFIEIQELLPDQKPDFSKAAAIKLFEDGTQVFCSNRGQDSISVFNVDPATGRMDFLNNAPLDGKFPRDFALMPGGKFALVGLKESWRLASYAYEKAKGTFTKVAEMEGVYRPLFFTFNLASAR